MAAVLVITTHGDIQVKNSRHPNLTEHVEKFEIHHDMTIVSLNAVSPSIPNLLPPKNVAPFVKIVRDSTSEFDESTTKRDMKRMVNDIREQIIEMDDQPENARSEIHSHNTNYTDDEEIMAYHYHSHELLYRIKSYSNRLVDNKQFLRENNLVKPRSSNWKLNLLNSGPTTDEDLMDTLNPSVGSLRSARTRDEYTVTRLETIIDELYSRGIRKLIIIDLSCSVIRKKQSGITRRGERNVALTEIREESPQSSSLGGRRTVKKHKRIKTTRKRYKK